MITITDKLDSLSPGLRAKIIVGERNYQPSPDTPVTNFLVDMKRHCNGGKTVDAGLWLRDHCDNGGKIFLTMAGAGSSFQQGKPISKLIRAGKIGAISVTGANLEESLYRLISNEDYVYIPDYVELTREEEKELARKGFRRITDTFLPEDETVRKVLPLFVELWREAMKEGKRYFWHEYFFMLFERNLIDLTDLDTENCWIYNAWKYNIPIVVPGYEDSTMGNIFTYYCYTGSDPLLTKYAQQEPISISIMRYGPEYMHMISEWYLEATKTRKMAFVQLGGGIAGDFPICLVPHVKKDFMADCSEDEQEAAVPPWMAFIEFYSSPMSLGSYSGAGGKEKITWEKLSIDSYIQQIFGDYTAHFPDVVAIILRM